MLLTMNDVADGFSYPASSRLGTALAPAHLVLSQELANTIGFHHLPQFADLLDQVETARQWIDAVVPYWCASFGVDDPRLVVTPAELPHLRAVRSALRATLGDAEPGADAVITGTVDITVTASGAHLEPRGSGADWLAAALAIEASTAEGHDTLRRLKLCNEAQCRTALYDRSKNNSRVWHDTATCGNQANARAHRARRRATARDNPSQ